MARLNGSNMFSANQLIEFPFVEKSRIVKTIQFQLCGHLLLSPTLAACAFKPYYAVFYTIFFFDYVHISKNLIISLTLMPRYIEMVMG